MNWTETRARLMRFGVKQVCLPNEWEYGIHLRDEDLSDADLSHAYLRGVVLHHVNLRGANLYGADIHRAGFHHVSMRGVDLSWAHARAAVMEDVDLRDSKMRDAEMYGATLRGVNLYGADLSCVKLHNADLYSVDLSHANLVGADLGKVCLDNVTSDCFTTGFHTAPEGDLIGWGKKSNHILKFLIPANARRSCATTRKHRAEYVKTLEIDDGALTGLIHRGLYDTVLYEVGKITHADAWDEDRWNECSHGIHFFLTRIEAEMWMM